MQVELNTNRLLGLRLLSAVDLPTPKIQIIYSLPDIDKLVLYDAPNGWTVRTCLYNSKNEFGLFYKNQCSEKELRYILHKRLSEYSNLEYYIVYESWEFFLGLNILFKDMIYVVEGKYSSQKTLAKGISVADFYIEFPCGFYSVNHQERGDISVETHTWVRRIIGALRKRIPWDSFYTEVAVTAEHKIMFYELWNLSLK